MKSYDYKNAKRFIEENKSQIKIASLGMKEDWFWTAETVFEDGEFKVDFDDDKLTIGGISSSQWGTPSLMIEMDGDVEYFKDCFVGESDGAKPEWISLGCLSEPVQNDIDKM